jgi:hypothetical protein
MLVLLSFVGGTLSVEVVVMANVGTVSVMLGVVLF